MGDRITYIGVDIHKDGIVVALAVGCLRGEVRDYGRIANTPAPRHEILVSMRRGVSHANEVSMPRGLS